MTVESVKNLTKKGLTSSGLLGPPRLSMKTTVSSVEESGDLSKYGNDSL